MFATDPLALRWMRRGIASGFDARIDTDLRVFFYLPLSHAENAAHQDEAVERMSALGEEDTRHARRHRDVIPRFGRFPHRNPMLGRETTAAEQAFLDAGGFAG